MNPSPGMLIAISVIAILGITAVQAEGQLTYGDKCSVQNAILNVFGSSDIPESEKCNHNQGLICTGTCTCPPTRTWDKGPLFGLFGGGNCLVGANGPCAKGDKCVPNAMCGENIPLCFCEEGYYAHDLQCISGSNHNLIITSGSAITSAGFKLSAVTLLPLLLLKVLLFKL